MKTSSGSTCRGLGHAARRLALSSRWRASPWTSKDNVFCFTRGEHPVIVFDRDGKFLRSWGEGAGPPRPRHHHRRRRHGVAHRRSPPHRPQVHAGRQAACSPSAIPTRRPTLQGGKPFNRPTHVAICPKSGFLFISDGYGNSRVHKYAPDGKHVMSWGEPGTDPGQFNLPHNLVTDRDGLVYVADRENHRVQIFDGKGRYQGQWNNLHRPCGLFVDRRERRALLRGRARPRPARQRRDAEPRPAGHACSTPRASGSRASAGQFASEKPGEFIAPARRRHRLARRRLRGRGLLHRHGPAREAAARDPLPPEVQARATSALRLGLSRIGKEAAGGLRDDVAASRVLERGLQIEVLPESRTARPAPEERPLDRRAASRSAPTARRSRRGGRCGSRPRPRAPRRGRRRRCRRGPRPGGPSKRRGTTIGDEHFPVAAERPHAQADVVVGAAAEALVKAASAAR